MYGLGSRLSGWSCGCRGRCCSSGNFALRLLLCVTHNELIHILHANSLQVSCKRVAGLGTFANPVLNSVLLAFKNRSLAVWNEMTDDLKSALLRAFGLLRHNDAERRGILSTGSLKADHKHRTL